MKIKCIALVVTALLSVNSAAAQTFSTPFQNGSQATRRLSANESYACFVSDSGTYKLSLNVTGPMGETITAINPPADPKVFEYFFQNASLFGDTALTDNIIVFNTTKGSAGNGDYKVTMESTNGMSNNPFLECTSTGVLCSFNTYSSDAVYLELTNVGSKPAIVSFFSLDFSGNVIERSVSVPAGVRNDFAVTPPLGSSLYGSLLVRPQVAPQFFGEGVRARVSQYRNGTLLGTQVCGPLIANNVT